MSTVITAGNATNGLSLTADNAGTFQFKTGTGAGTTAMTIDASQNVGVGTTSPRSVAGYTTLGINNTTGGFTDIFAANTRVASFGADATSTYVSAVASAPLLFSTGNTERARIDSSGNLRVGTTAGIVSTEKASINAGASGGYGLCVSTSTTGGFSPLLLRNNDGNATNAQVYFVYGASTFVGSISTTSSSTAYNTSSDYRLKESIAPMTGALATVAQLKPVTYKWKVDGSDGQGFIAHELQAVVPDCVNGEKDAVDADGNPKYQGVDTSFLVATLTAAIQELKAELDAVKAKVGA